MSALRSAEPATTAFCKTAFTRGVRNLLNNCLQLSSGQTLLIFHESTAFAEADLYYCARLPDAIATIAEQQGIKVALHEVPVVEDANSLEITTLAAAKDADATVFLARCGDQLRFNPCANSTSVAVVYAVNGPMMASGFALVPHQSMLSLRAFLDNALKSTELIRVTCPYGTDYQGRWEQSNNADVEVSCMRFPVAIGQPVPGSGFTGTIATPAFLVGSGSRFFQPYALELARPLVATIEDNRIEALAGKDADVSRTHDFYTRVSERYGIDAWLVNSWHAGIHAGCDYPWPASENYQRWSGTAFGNPRLAHVHTCGDYAPGEICWNIVDPTITLDDVPVWDQGRLQPQRLPGGEALLAEHPELQDILANPATAIGL
ncbi:MAG: hypothetical protein KTR33_07535 [Gammaproteobacteria bacterium]|nr:hypothetical protein [Gammaproteobacteria bacterium]